MIWICYSRITKRFMQKYKNLNKKNSRNSKISIDQNSFHHFLSESTNPNSLISTFFLSLSLHKSLFSVSGEGERKGLKVARKCASHGTWKSHRGVLTLLIKMQATLPGTRPLYRSHRKNGWILESGDERETTKNICRINISCTEIAGAPALSSLSTITLIAIFNHKKLLFFVSLEGKKGLFIYSSIGEIARSLILIREKFRFLLDSYVRNRISINNYHLNKNKNFI